MELKNHKSIQPICATLEENADNVIIIFSNSDQDRFLPVHADPFEAEMFIREMRGENNETAAVFLSEMMADFPPAEAILHPKLRKIEFLFQYSDWSQGRLMGLADGITLARRLSCRLFAHQDDFNAQQAEIDRLSSSGAITNNSVYFSPDYSPGLHGYSGFRHFLSAVGLGDKVPQGSIRYFG